LDICIDTLPDDAIRIQAFFRFSSGSPNLRGASQSWESTVWNPDKFAAVNPITALGQPKPERREENIREKIWFIFCIYVS